jgi:hypothetical protein
LVLVNPPLSEVQTALFNALTPALAPVLVVDQAGPNQEYPYATIGEFVGGHDDTLNEQAVNLDVTVHIWSREPGMQQCQQLMTAAKNALDRQRLQAGLRSRRSGRMSDLTQPDGRTRQDSGVSRRQSFEVA